MLSGTAALRQSVVRFWLPPLLAGLVTLIAAIVVGATPPVRALGIAAAIVGICLALRRFGALYAFAGGLALTFSPAFWSQTGGGLGAGLSPVFIILVIALLAALMAGGVLRRPFLGMAVGLVVFTLSFWVLIATPRSLRMTTVLMSWTLFLLIDALMTASPRPDGPAPARLKAYHTVGLLVLIVLGTLNDPLFVLLIPAAAIGFILTRERLPWWFWGILLIATGVGIRGLVIQYLDSGWWGYSAARAQELGLRVPFVIADGWRDADRWLHMIQIVSGQFTVAGVMLGILGLARLSRWYPGLGIITLIGYAAFGLFGLVYFGADGPILLLPMFFIQMIWITYAVYALGQWLQKGAASRSLMIRWLVPVAFTLLPLAQLLRIAGVI